MEVMHDGEEPRAQVGIALPLGHPAQGSIEAILYKVFALMPIPCE